MTAFPALASPVVSSLRTCSWCSIQFGAKRTPAAPESAQNQFLIVSDIQAARAARVGRGVELSEVFHLGPDGPVGGPDPEHRSYASFASFGDPDGNRWLLQEDTTRLPGRIDSNETTFASALDMANAMRRASAAHGEHEKRHGGKCDVTWPDWYGAYMPHPPCAVARHRSRPEHLQDPFRGVAHFLVRPGVEMALIDSRFRSRKAA